MVSEPRKFISLMDKAFPCGSLRWRRLCEQGTTSGLSKARRCDLQKNGTPRDKWDVRADKAFDLITRSLSDDQIKNIQPEATVVEAWRRLEEIHEAKGMQNLYRLWKRFHQRKDGHFNNHASARQQGA